MGKGVGVIGLVREFEDVHLFVGAEELEHFLFAVAGGLGDHELGLAEKGVSAGDVIPVSRFDEWADVGREKAFGGGDGVRRPAAEADRDGAGGKEEFAWGEFAHDADERVALGLRSLRVLKAVVDHVVKPGERRGGACPVLGSVSRSCH